MMATSQRRCTGAAYLNHAPTKTRFSQVAEGYRAMDERRAIKTLLRPQGD
jgi:hypothetical protein